MSYQVDAPVVLVQARATIKWATSFPKIQKGISDLGKGDHIMGHILPQNPERHLMPSIYQSSVSKSTFDVKAIQLIYLVRNGVLVQRQGPSATLLC